MTQKEAESEDLILLDVLIAATENWKLIVFGPVIATTLVILASLLWPKTYESVSIVRLNEADQVLINTDAVLNPLIEKLGLLKSFDGSKDEAREYLAKKITSKFDKKSGLVTITTKGSTPEQAQEIGKATINFILLELLPKGKYKDKIEQTIRINENIISNNSDAIEQLKKQMAKSTAGDSSLDVVMKHYASLSAEVSRKELDNIELTKSLTINGDEFYVQPPSKPEKHNSPKLSLVASVSMLGSELILILYLFMRQAIFANDRREIFRKKLSIVKKNLNLHK